MTKRHKRKTARPVCPICDRPPPDRGLPLTVPFGIPTYWSSHTAHAIFEFIDEMRDIMFAVYETRIANELRQQQQNSPLIDCEPMSDDELPF